MYLGVDLHVLDLTDCKKIQTRTLLAVMTLWLNCIVLSWTYSLTEYFAKPLLLKFDIVYAYIVCRVYVLKLKPTKWQESVSVVFLQVIYSLMFTHNMSTRVHMHLSLQVKLKSNICQELADLYM